jgi:hypothetical protein
MRSPLTLFAGIFSVLEAVVLAFLSDGKAPLDPVDGLVVILLTVVLFGIIVLARPQALYPPEEWKEAAPAPEARLALWALVIFIMFIGGGWAMKFAGPGWSKIFGGKAVCPSAPESPSNELLQPDAATPLSGNR